MGHGGQFVSCLLFSKKFISFITPGIIPPDKLPKELYSKNLFYNWNIFLSKINNKAYFLSHNGLGDNITNIGAVRFLLQYYDTIYFLCKDIYEENVKLLFDERVITVPFDSNNETNECKRILTSIYDDYFISGFFHNYLKPRIRHPELLKYVKNNEYSLKYQHVFDFYNDIGLDTFIYVDYFHIESTNISKKYYDNIKNYKIVFLHTKGSNRSIDLTKIIDLYKNEDEYIIICNENVYDKNNLKYKIVDEYKHLKIAEYIDIIKNADIIHVIDSCFACIIYPLSLSNKITKKCVIHDV